MAQKPAAPFNNPFGELSNLRDQLSPAAPSVLPTKPKPTSEVEPAGWGKLVVMCEKKGRAGKTVTRIKGLPAASLSDCIQRMKLAFGCGANQEEGDLILQGSHVERAKEWLENHGARLVVVSGGAGRAKVVRAQPSRAVPNEGRVSTRDGKRRADLEGGLTVDIVLKRDQPSGALTRGVIRDILTKSPLHPHGIKVRLTDGSVGRVKHVIAPSG